MAGHWLVVLPESKGTTIRGDKKVLPDPRQVWGCSRWRRRTKATRCIPARAAFDRSAVTAAREVSAPRAPLEPTCERALDLWCAPPSCLRRRLVGSLLWSAHTCRALEVATLRSPAAAPGLLRGKPNNKPLKILSLWFGAFAAPVAGRFTNPNPENIQDVELNEQGLFVRQPRRRS